MLAGPDPAVSPGPRTGATRALETVPEYCAPSPVTSVRMKSIVPLILVLLVAVGVLGSSVLKWMRQADPVWTAHADQGTASITGKVALGDGRPVPGIEVIWYAEADAGSHGTVTAFGGELRARTAADGVFRFDSVPLRNGFLGIDEAQAKHGGRTGEFVPRAGYDAVLDVAAEPVDERRILKGRLLTADGAPAVQMLVVASTGSLVTTWQYGTSTDDAGGFEILLPWAADEVELKWRPLDDSAPYCEPVAVKPGPGIEVRMQPKK